MDDMSYKDKFIQMNKEAKACWISALIIIIFWFITGFGIYAVAPRAQIFNAPAWFIISCFGSWILSMVIVPIMLKTSYKDFDLGKDAEDEEEVAK